MNNETMSFDQLVPIHSLSVCFWNISEAEKNIQTSPLWCDYRTEQDRQRERQREKESQIFCTEKKKKTYSRVRVSAGVFLLNQCHCCHPRHLDRPARRPVADRPPRRTLRWQCDRRGIDQASESNGPAVTGFSQPYLSIENRSIKSFHKTSAPLCSNCTHLKRRSYQRPLTFEDIYRLCTENLLRWEQKRIERQLRKVSD